ncbi:hypothetical protein [Candidatus Lokiarchaeum ossiferum]|uniref:hypothetical protein n=1 Tax=Candidatus Lokiarchaeum ossiferum TaxID=2951803 RepID=UPI00352D84FD
MTRTHTQKIILGIFLIGLVGFIGNISSASALSRGAEVAPVDPLIIDDAYYCDKDGDGLEDDVITIFTLYSPTGLLADVDAVIDLSILLPSGQIFSFSYRLKETFIELELTIEWYNCAVEDGWYDFTVLVDMHGFDIDRNHFDGTVTETLTFDPREVGGAGLPFAIVLY